MVKKNTKWFKKVRGSYIPNSWEGALTYIPYVAYLLASYLYAMLYFGYSATSLFIIVPNWVAAVAIMNYIASKKS